VISRNLKNRYPPEMVGRIYRRPQRIAPITSVLTDLTLSLRVTATNWEWWGGLSTFSYSPLRLGPLCMTSYYPARFPRNRWISKRDLVHCNSVREYARTDVFSLIVQKVTGRTGAASWIATRMPWDPVDDGRRANEYARKTRENTGMLCKSEK